MCFLGLHDWETMGNKRKCRKCGTKQILSGSIDDFSWETVTNFCYRCDGKGKTYDNDFNVVICPVCNGSGKENENV